MRKTNSSLQLTQSHLSGFLYCLTPCKFHIFKLSLSLSRLLVRAQTAFYELKGGLSLVMLKEIFHVSLKKSKFSSRICMETIQAWSIGWQKIHTLCSLKILILFSLSSLGSVCYQSYFPFCMLRSDGSCTGGKLINNYLQPHMSCYILSFKHASRPITSRLLSKL